MFHRYSKEYEGKAYDIGIGNNYRFNKKLTISTQTNLEFRQNNLGYATRYGVDSIVFALRKRNTVENILTIKYNFNNKMGLSFRARHYWSNVENQQFFSLQSNGTLKPIPGGISNNVNYNVNYFNIDMVYTWQFALGSFINMLIQSCG